MSANADEMNYITKGQDTIMMAGTEIGASIDFEDALFLERFRRRRDEAAASIESERNSRPPSNSSHFDDPQNVVISLLSGLLHAHDPVPYFGYEILYSASTEDWREVLRKSVGASNETKEELIYRALGSSMERENNQFGILVGLGTDDGTIQSTGMHLTSQAEDYYTIEFPYDTLDYYDGTAWLECRLRNKETDTLLVVLGWSMQKREDGAWLVDGIDWQDFREKYRPGIGREEWERICG